MSKASGCMQSINDVRRVMAETCIATQRGVLTPGQANAMCNTVGKFLTSIRLESKERQIDWDKLY